MLKSLMAAAALSAAMAAANPLGVVAPCVSLSSRELRALGRGEVVARTLPSNDHQVAVLAVTRLTATPATLVESTRNIAELKKSSFVTAIHRFSDPPRLSDLDALMLVPRDIEALSQCQPGRCSFKLSQPEIQAIANARAVAAADADAVPRAFRRVLFDRVNAYLAGGLEAIPAIANRSNSHALAEIMAELRDESHCAMQLPPLAEWLRGVPRRGNGVESFLYWSQESYGAGKPVTLVTHVAILHDSPDRAIVVGKQIFSSRYMDGAISLTAITTDAATGARHLIYLNRSAVDLLGGFFGGLKRSLLESRLKGEIPEIIQRLRGRLERPPS